jgi:hypothetical protein
MGFMVPSLELIIPALQVLVFLSTPSFFPWAQEENYACSH